MAHATSRPGPLCAHHLRHLFGALGVGGDDFDLHGACCSRWADQLHTGLPALCMNSLGNVVWNGGIGIDSGTKGMIGYVGVAGQGDANRLAGRCVAGVGSVARVEVVDRDVRRLQGRQHLLHARR